MTTRARSLSLSSTDDDARSAVSAPIQTISCEWGDCRESFYELEPLIEHLTTAHVNTLDAARDPTNKGNQYICGWCQKSHGAKFALITHLRSHTGERPFTCPRSGQSPSPQPVGTIAESSFTECDKSLTRLDALQKHLRTVHGDVILMVRGGTVQTSSKKRKTNRAVSVESEVHPVGEDHQPHDEPASNEIVWTASERATAAKHADLSLEKVGYIVEKAKWNYLLKEHEGLLNELEVVMTSEAELGMECEELLGMIMRNELNSTSVLSPFRSLPS